MQALPEALAALGAYKQFGIYFTRPSATRPGKIDKFPADFRSGRVVSAHDPQYWTDAQSAIAAAANFGAGYGVSFTFTAADPFFFVDLDDALLDDGSGWKPHAIAICQLLNGAAVEISVSGKGLHLFGKYSGPMPPHRCESQYKIGGFYHDLRYVALTGNGAIGNAGADLTAALPTLIDTYWKAEGSTSDASDWSDGPIPEWRGPTDDEELIRRALRSQSSASAFGGRASFADLWTGNVEALSRCYPDPARGYDSSSADAALAQHLAFWTGKDCGRIERLMRGSALARDKWEREDYLPRTISGAVARQVEVLTDRVIEPVAGAAQTPLPTATHEAPTPKLVEGAVFASISDQFTIFKGCVYVRDVHRVLIPGGTLLKPDQFRVHFGGYRYCMDHANEKSTADAWEAFTLNQAYRAPRADGTCFKPNLPPGAVIVRDGLSYVNTYTPVEVERKVGDATPFFTHMAKLIPDERDRYILLCYMAACVQHQGVKFQWAPIVQGVEGNGKTFLSRCVAEAVGRRYVHWPKASKIAAQFNSWLVGKVFYAVEDIYVPDQKRDVIEELKPMITGGDGLEIEAKGVDQVSADICGNFMFNSNHKDAVIKTRKDRRFANFFTAQQSVEDLVRDGMGSDYQHQLYNWFWADGKAIVADLLWTMPIPDEFNPATHCQRAPTTTSTHEAIEASRGGIEQEIIEAVQQGAPGFCGGWVSSMMLERLLDRLGRTARVTHVKRREMLEGLGYIPHPALSDGRVNNLVLPDNGKPRLFVLADGPARHIASAAEAAKAYEQANNHVGASFPFRA